MMERKQDIAVVICETDYKPAKEHSPRQQTHARIHVALEMLAGCLRIIAD